VASLNQQAGIFCQLEELLAMAPYSRLLDLKGPWRSKELFSGNNASRIKGRGLDFAELKNYQPGDDVRHMDWKKTHSSGRPHVRVFEEDKEQKVSLLVDQSRSMFFASQGQMKSVVAAQLASLIGWRSLSDGDRLALQIITDSGSMGRPFSRSKENLVAGLKQLVEANQQLAAVAIKPKLKNCSLTQCLQQLLHSRQLGRQLYIISDFNALAEPLLDLLRQCNASAQIRLLLVVDPLEQRLPRANNLVASDGVGQLLVDGLDRKFQLNYKQQFEQKCRDLQRLQAVAGNNGQPLSLHIIHTEQAALPQLLALQSGRH